MYLIGKTWYYMDGNENNNKVEKRFRGWNRKGFRWDKTSEKYKLYAKRHMASRNQIARQRWESLAKAPLPNRHYYKRIYTKNER